MRARGIAVIAGRRRCLTLGVAGIAVTVLGCGEDEEAAESCVPADAALEPTSAAPPENVEEIADWLLQVEQAQLVPELRTKLGAQWTSDSVFAGLLLAGARFVHSKYGGGGFHAVLQVAALRYFTERAPEQESLVPLVYGILTTRNASTNDPWTLPPVDEANVPSAEGAGARFVAAVDAGSLDEALLECTALARAGDAGRLHALLLEVGSRRAHHLGHEAICAAKVIRALVDLPGAWAEDVYRAMVVAMVGPTLPEGPDHSDVWRANRERVLRVPCAWTSGTDDPSAVRTIAAAMRSVTDPMEDITIVEAHLNAGVSPRSIWEGIALAAGESAFGGANYHAITSVEALHDAYLLAASERVRLMLLLQAAAHVALVTHPVSLSGVPLADVAPEASPLDEIFESWGVPSVTRALGYLHGGGDENAYVERVMELARTRATDEHHYKIVHSAMLAADRVSTAWRSHILALARMFAPKSDDATNLAWELTLEG